jgi:hypothetical protein
MLISNLRGCILVLSLLGSHLFIYAQDYFTGRVVDPQGNEQQVFYDRTQYAIGIAVYQSVYKVMDTKSKPLYTITITHDQAKARFYFAVKTEGSGANGTTEEYDPDISGLIFSDLSNTDTAFDFKKHYKYLVSFTDVDRDYPVLHEIKVKDGKEVLLDPLTRVRIKYHIEMIAKIPAAVIADERKQRQELAMEANATKKAVTDTAAKPQVEKTKPNNTRVEKDSFNIQLVDLRNLFYAHNAELTQSIDKITSRIEGDIIALLGNDHIYSDERRYEGEKKNGKPDGKGLLMSDGNIYDGLFAKGKFISGDVILRNEVSEYYGEYKNDSMNGTGWLKYKNGGYVLGEFRNGILYEGVMLSKAKGGELFYGCVSGSDRNGYAELRNAQGSSYYGEFLNGRLVKGLCREVDQFGYTSYSKIDAGAKKAIDSQQAEEFFGGVVSQKK